MFKESLYPLSDGSWLAITLDASAEHEPPTRHLEFAYARVHHPDGSTRELFDLLTIPVAADTKAAKTMTQMAAGQRQMAEQSAGTRSEAQYRKAEQDYTAKAEALRRTTRGLPVSVHLVGPTQLLCAYQRHQAPPCFRLVDLASEAELWSLDGQTIADQISQRPSASKPIADPAREIEKLMAGVDLNSLSEEDSQALMERIEALSAHAQAPDDPVLVARRLSLLAASDNRMLLNAGMEKVLVEVRQGKLHTRARWPSLHGSWPLAARTAEGFVFHCVTGHDGRDEVLHVRATDGAELDRWSAKGRRTLCDAAETCPPGEVVALGALGGQVLLHQAGQAPPLVVPKLLGLDKYDSVSVALSPNAAIVAMGRSFEAKSLALYDRQRALAAQLPCPAVEVQTQHGDHQLRMPGFALSERALWMLAAGKLREIPFDALDWQTPSAPAAPIKRLKTAALTLDKALKQEPLASIADQIQCWFRPGVVLTPKRVCGDTLPVGSSKAGGLPDLSADCPWPRCQDQPMAFLLQINLAEVAAVDASLGLPLDGLLSVILAFDDCPMPSFYSDVNSDPEGCRVIYTPASAPLHRTTPPPNMPKQRHDGTRTVCSYTMKAGGPMLPELSNDRVQRAQLTPAQANAYRELVTAINGDDESPQHWATRLGGNPALLQNDDLHLQAESNARSLPQDDTTYTQWTDPSFQQVAQRWRQLLQLAEGKEGWTWGDAGLMHVMVRADQWDCATFTQGWGIGVCH